MKKTAIFLGLTCLINWSLALAFYLSGLKFEGIYGMAFGAFYMLIPMAVAIFVQKVIYKEELCKPLLISFKLNKWILLAIFVPPVINFLSIFINLMMPGVAYAPDMSGLIERFASTVPADQLELIRQSVQKIHPFLLMLITLLQGIGFGATVNAVFAFGEELGWRGFLVNQMRSMHFVMASVIIGFIWGLWHFPLILMGHNYPQHPVAGVFMMIAFCILLTPVFLYVLIKTKSVLGAAIIHGVVNGTGGLSIMPITGGNDLIVGMTGLAGFIAISVGVLVLFLVDTYVLKEKVMWKTLSQSIGEN